MLGGTCLNIGNLDTAILGVVENLVVKVGVVEESFRWDTSDVKTCAAQNSALLDTGDLL